MDEAEDAHAAVCEDTPPHSINDCDTYGYDQEGLFLR